MSQNYTSKATSINGKQGKLPALYNKITFPKGAVVLDYGCGDVTNLMEEKAANDGALWFGYDLFNQPDEVNEKSEKMLNNGVDIAIACNLLNVIDDEEVIKDIINKLIPNANETIFQIYEGKGDGVGKVTGSDQYQRNAKRSWYEELIRSLGYTVTKATGNYIYCKGDN